MPFVADNSAGKFVPDKAPAAAAPQEDSFGLGDVLTMAKDVAMKGGPLALPGLMAGPGMTTVNKAIEKGAYKAGGAVTDLAAGHMSPEMAALLGYGTNVGVQAIPVIAGGMLGGKAAPVMERGAEELMQSALKPSATALRTGKGARAVKTLLKKGVNVTPGGVQKLQAEIDKLNEAITQAVARSPESVDKVQVANRLRDALQKFKMQVNPQADVKTINRAWDEFINHPLLTGKERIPVQLAQQLKQGTYKVLGGEAYGARGQASTEAQKALARGLKEEIAKVVPNIDKLNKDESELLNALELTANRVLMDANKNPMGLGWLAMHPGTWLGFAADRSPLVKSLLARLISSGKTIVPQTAGQVVGAGAGAALGIPPLSLPQAAPVNPTAPMPISGAIVPNPYPSREVQGDGVRG